MDSGKLNDWAQVVGIFALVASLIFVGMQMKQAHEIALSEAYQERANSSIDISLAASVSPEFTSASAKLYRGNVEGLTPEEHISLEYWFGASMTMYENHYFQYVAGFLPEDHWSKNLSELCYYFSEPFFVETMDGWTYRESFQLLVDEIKNDAQSKTGICK